MLYQIKGITKEGIPQEFIDIRVQYFFNYWTYILAKNKRFLNGVIDFESHRTLLYKINYQLSENFEYSYPKFKRLFIQNDLFDVSNVIAKKQAIKRNKAEIVSLASSGNQYKANKERITKLVRNIDNYLLKNNDYDKLLTKSLCSLLDRNHFFRNNEIKNIEFLVRAIIIELYKDGYSKEYLRKIPQIFTFNHINPLKEFPFEKTIIDFDFDEKKFETYLSEQAKSLTLEKVLSGLNNLLNRKIINGFAIFKVDNLKLTNPSTIKIGEVEFYNPLKNRKINTSSLKSIKKVNEYLALEQFLNPYGNSTDTKEASECNAIIPLSFRNSIKADLQRNFIRKFNEVQKALNVLNGVINTAYSTQKIVGKLNFGNHFFLHNNFKVAKYNLGIFHDKIFNYDDSNDDFRKYRRRVYSTINKLNLERPIEKKVYDIYSKLKDLELREDFNFKDLWITWESFLPGEKPKDKKNKFIDISKKVLTKVFNNSYLVDMKLFLGNNLKKHQGTTNQSNSYKLDDRTIKQIGLDLPPLKIISTSKLKNNYSKLTQNLNIQIIKELEQKIHTFINDNQILISNLEDWIENVIEDIYIERNSEVHSNRLNDFSMLKLKDDFIYISNILCFQIMENINRNNRTDLDKIINKICT